MKEAHMYDFLTSLNISDNTELIAFIKTSARIALILTAAIIIKLVAGRLISTFKNYLKDRSISDMEEYKRIDTIGRVFRYIVNILIIVIAGIQTLNELGISIAPVLAAAGVVGVAVGFGAQSLVKDYFIGFFLLLENQVRQGDVAELGGKSGFVEEVTLRYIKMRDYDGNVHYVPNGAITTVTNMSREYAQSVIDIGVAYREDVSHVMDVMQEVGKALREDNDYKDKILDDMEMAGVEQLADSAVIIRCRFKVLPLQQWGVRREYFKRLKAAFDEKGIEIPFPHLTVYPGEDKHGSAPALHMKNINT